MLALWLSTQVPVTAAPVLDASEKLVDKGVLGVFCVLLIAAVVYKDRQLTKAQERAGDLAEKYSTQLALNTEYLRERR